MSKFPVVLDLETKHSFREFEKARDLGISVVGVYDYKTQEALAFREKDLHKLFLLLENASYTIGFNNRSFDMQVLQAYYPGDITAFSVFDICDAIREKLGRRLALNDITSVTLGKKKTGHGLHAIDLYKEGKWEELTRYCLDDVLLTRDLFDFGAQNGYVSYLSEVGKEKIVVDWKKYLEDPDPKDMPLTLPF